MSPQDQLRRQIIADLERLHRLIVRYARGDYSVKQERDQMEGAVQVKMAVWHAVRDG